MASAGFPPESRSQRGGLLPQTQTVGGMVRLVYELRRGLRGLGIDINARNEVVGLHADGQALVDGLAQVGDILEAVDGSSLLGLRLPEAMVPGKRAYELIVQRHSVPLDAAVARTYSPVPLLRCLEVSVRRGPKGMGIDIGNVSSVRGLIPGGVAEQDGMIQQGDLIVAVDRTPVRAPQPSYWHPFLLRITPSAGWI